MSPATEPPTPHRLRRFRFSLRTVLVVTFIVALLFAARNVISPGILLLLLIATLVIATVVGFAVTEPIDTQEATTFRRTMKVAYNIVHELFLFGIILLFLVVVLNVILWSHG